MFTTGTFLLSIAIFSIFCRFEQIKSKMYRKSSFVLTCRVFISSEENLSIFRYPYVHEFKMAPYLVLSAYLLPGHFAVVFLGSSVQLRNGTS